METLCWKMNFTKQNKVLKYLKRLYWFLKHPSRTLVVLMPAKEDIETLQNASLVVLYAEKNHVDI